MKSLLRGGLLGAALLLIAATGAGAAAPGGGADEFYTLDGERVERAVAVSAAGGCAAGASASGEIVCFSSEAEHRRVQLDALKADKVPPGFAALPPAATRERIIAAMERRPAARASSRPRKRRGPIARAADAYICNEWAQAGWTRVWVNAGPSGNVGWFGYTGIGVWRNHTSDFYNEVTAYHAQNYATSRWHDGPNGTSHYYGYGYACRMIESLTNSPHPAGGTWNDKFSSYAAW